jgi:hypothetical protein
VTLEGFSCADAAPCRIGGSATTWLEDRHCEGAAQCPARRSARRSARRNAVTVQLAVAAEFGRGTKSRGGQGLIGCREKRDFGEEPPRQGLETWISFSPSIAECAVQPMRHGSLSSQIQAAAADVLDRMWTSLRGAGGTKLQRMPIRSERSAYMGCGSDTRLR